MNIDPQMMAMLASQLNSPQQPAQVNGIQPTASPLGGAAELAQKVMLMNALKQGQKSTPPSTPGYLPGAPQPQTMNANPGAAYA